VPPVPSPLRPGECGRLRRNGQVTIPVGRNLGRKWRVQWRKITDETMEETMEVKMGQTMGWGYRRAATGPRPRTPKEPTGGGPGGNSLDRHGTLPPPRPPRCHNVAAPEGGPELPIMGTGHAPADGAPSVATTTPAPHPKRARTGAVCMRGYGRCVLSPPRPETPATGGGTSLMSCGDVEASPGPPPPDWGEEDSETSSHEGPIGFSFS